MVYLGKLKLVYQVGVIRMSLNETFELLKIKETDLASELHALQVKMKLIEENINGIEMNPNFLETEVQPLYESLWNLQMSYKKHQTELNTIQLQLHQMNQILHDLTKTNESI